MADRHTTEKLLEGERLSGKVTLFAKVTILPGDELPYHEHHGETEVYHILSGEGIYQDNNKTYPMQAGMTTFCEDGSGHAVARWFELLPVAEHAADPAPVRAAITAGALRRQAGRHTLEVAFFFHKSLIGVICKSHSLSSLSVSSSSQGGPSSSGSS